VSDTSASRPVVALVGDLMDRSRVSAAAPDVVFASTPTAAAERGPSVVVVDLARHGGAIAALRAALPTARIIGFGPHVDGDAADAARRDGADLVLARSRFFRRVAETIAEASEPDPDPGHPPP
jgi:hypothetical protein